MARSSTSFKKGHKGYNNGEKLKGKTPWNKGKEYPTMKGNKYRLGISPWSKGKTKLDFPQLSNSGTKKGHVPWNKGKRCSQLQGKNHWNWQGGITSINRNIRTSIEYKLWRDSVLKRDNFTCRFCGKRGGKLVADHIKAFADYPELRFAIDNGRTLCVDCHRKTETYGWNLHNKK